LSAGEKPLVEDRRLFAGFEDRGSASHQIIAVAPAPGMRGRIRTSGAGREKQPLADSRWTEFRHVNPVISLTATDVRPTRKLDQELPVN
jgi:hypothetical protein